MDRLKALSLLDECTGVDIWPVEYCRERGVPEAWIEALADAYESGYETPWHTIFCNGCHLDEGSDPSGCESRKH